MSNAAAESPEGSAASSPTSPAGPLDPESEVVELTATDRDDLPDPYVVGSEFKNQEEARAALVKFTLARGLSYKVRSCEMRRYVVVCRDPTCQFRLRITGRTTGSQRTTISKPHTCDRGTHFGWRPGRAAAGRPKNSDRRSIVACNVCKARKTKCDGQRPECRYCQTHLMNCVYPSTPSTPNVGFPVHRVQHGLGAVTQRLNFLASPLGACQNPAAQIKRPEIPNGAAEGAFNFEPPFRLLGVNSVMGVFGVDVDLTQTIMKMERAPKRLKYSTGNASRLFVLHREQVSRALKSFCDLIHVWYPILPSDFPDLYFRILSGPVDSSPQSCLVLLVAALGFSTQGDEGKAASESFFDAALSSLPVLVSECSLTCAQCLVFFAIYFCCLLTPCQAHSYSLMAASKIQNILKSGLGNHEPGTLETINRTYWAALLIENELSPHFDVSKSNIFHLDEFIALPNGRQLWQFRDQPADISMSRNSSPATRENGITEHASTDDTGMGNTEVEVAAGLQNALAESKQELYFLAEITLKRMLYRCNAAFVRNHIGKFNYAPQVALEVDQQLETWRNYLPEAVRFDISSDLTDEPAMTTQSCQQSNFLRVQYYCCKLVVYWPAVLQVIQDKVPNDLLLDHSRRFFDTYMRLTPRMISACQECEIFKWTLYSSLFTFTLATMKAASFPLLNGLCSRQIYERFASVARVDDKVFKDSPSLMMLLRHLKKFMKDARYAAQNGSNA